MVGIKGQVQQRGVERRNAIVDAAIVLFSQKGYGRTGLSDIAHEVGVTAPNILHHFGSKERLLLAVVAEVDRRNKPTILEVYEPGGLETLRRLRTFVSIMEREPVFSALHLMLEAENLDDDGPIREYVLRRSRNLRKLLTEALREGQERGEIRKDADAARLGREIAGYLEGAARIWLVDPSLPLADLYDSYLDRLIDHLTAA